jgi:hypothetical protein
MMKVPAEAADAVKRKGTFTLRDVYVGCITKTHVVKATKKWSSPLTEADGEQAMNNWDSMRKDWDQVDLFWYKLATHSCSKDDTLASNARPIPEIETSMATFENTNWGPCKADVGDIIVVAAGSKIPLVLRKNENKFLFVGGCLLVDSQIDVTKLRLDCGEQEGFLKIMYGSVVEEIGKTCEVKEFGLC